MIPMGAPALGLLLWNTAETTVASAPAQAARRAVAREWAAAVTIQRG